ncbi:MAG: peptidylprolyl isomerase [Desulfobulbaceae bacterium]|nr:peptidylprolyl isomerase [Desulfobulbaceae bacterium]
MGVVSNDMYVAINYNLALEDGVKVDFTKEGEPYGFIVGCEMVVPGLEKALMGKEKGYRSLVVVEAEDGFGPAYQELYQKMPREKFPKGIEPKPGMTFKAAGNHGDMLVTVDSVNNDDTITINMNHPLAGKRLLFEVELVDVRKATEEELAEAKSRNKTSGGEHVNEASAGCACGREKK